MNKKTLLIAFAIIIISGTVVFLLNTLGQTTQEIASPPTNRYNISTHTEKSVLFPINVNVAVNNLPTSMSTYLISDEGMSDQEIVELANKSGITTKPIEFADNVFGKTVIFSSVSDYLRVVPGSRIIDYKRVGVSIKEPLDKDVELDLFRKSAINFLKTKGFLKNIENYSEYSTDLLTIVDEAEIKGVPANVVSLSYVNSTGDYPILGSSSATGTLNVMLNNKAEIYRVYVDAPPEVTMGKNYKTKSLEDVKSSSIDNFTIQKIGNGSDYIVDVADSIAGVEINDIKPAYYQEYDNQKQEMLLPVYVCSGTATKLNGEVVNIELYIPAISDNQE